MAYILIYFLNLASLVLPALKRALLKPLMILWELIILNWCKFLSVIFSLSLSLWLKKTCTSFVRIIHSLTLCMVWYFSLNTSWNSLLYKYLRKIKIPWLWECPIYLTKKASSCSYHSPALFSSTMLWSASLHFHQSLTFAAHSKQTPKCLRVPCSWLWYSPLKFRSYFPQSHPHL